MSILGNRVLGGAGQQPYLVGRSLRFRSSASAYLNRTPASASNRTTWTWSGWVKRGLLTTTSKGLFSAVSGLETLDIVFEGNTGATADTLRFVYYTGSALNGNLVSTPVYRDPSAWYHIVAVWNTTDATSSNRMRLYVNGVEVTAFGTASYPTQNTSALVNNTVSHTIGRYSSTTNYFDGYLAEVNFIDGQALTPSSFGAYDTNGVWQPIKYGGTYGTNGFYLPFSDNSALTTSSNAGLGKDFSGNGNYWATNNISITAGTTYDSMIDSPSNYTSASNYAVLNPLSKASPVSLTNGNLNSSSSSGSDNYALSTIIVNNIKFYAEMQPTTTPGRYSPLDFGARSPVSPTNAVQFYLTNYSGDGPIYWDNGSSGYVFTGGSSPYAYTATTSDIFQVACDPVTGKVWLGKNNSWFDSSGGVTGNPSTGANPTYTFSTASLNLGVAIGTSPFSATDGSTGSGAVNFGQRPFSYTPPTGFNALNTYNLLQPTIMNGAKYMAATLWTGDGTNPRTITNTVNNAAFQPDFIWTKVRSTTYSNTLYDDVRGGANVLFSDTTSAESQNYANGQILSFNSNGFNINSGVVLNQSSQTYVGWQWNAGSGVTSTNTSGSISSLVSVNPTAGFSIVSYTGNGVAGATVGHGLGVAPSMFVLKSRSSVQDWNLYHVSLGPTVSLELNLTLGSAATSNFNSTSPTSTVFSVGSGGGSNASGTAYIAYCWSAVAGYSAFGSYTGNGSTDGPFIYTGFRPRWVMIKASSTTGDWTLWDTSRTPYNATVNTLFADLSQAEDTSQYPIDVLSNGFKLRNTSSGAGNGSGQTYVYAAFAENPFKVSRAR